MVFKGLPLSFYSLSYYHHTMSAIQNLYDKIVFCLEKYTSTGRERISQQPLDLPSYEKNTPDWQQYLSQYVALGRGGRVIAHGTLEETLRGIPTETRKSGRTVVFYASPRFFEKKVRFVGL